MAINLRSPYYRLTAFPTTAYAELDISIWSGSVTNPPATAQYSLRKNVVGSSSEVTFEISELIRDYLDITFNGYYTAQTVWVKLVQTAYRADDFVLYDKYQYKYCF